VTFAFEIPQGHVGIALPFQVVISSSAHEKSTAIRLAGIHLRFAGGLRDTKILHDDSGYSQASTANSQRQLYVVSSQRSMDDILVGKGELTLAPGCAKAFSLAALPLDSGNAELSSVTLHVINERFELAILFSDREKLRQNHSWAAKGTTLSKKPLYRERNLSVEILPKPPKMQIHLPNLAKAYFTSEHIELAVHVINNEEEDAIVDLDVRMLGQEEEMPTAMRWASVADEQVIGEIQKNTEDGPDRCTNKRLLTTALGEMTRLETRKHGVRFQASSQTSECSLELKARYHLASDPETPISKVLSIDLHFMRPFEANFQFRPGISDEPWPNYFEFPDVSNDLSNSSNEQTAAEGLTQKSILTAAIASFAPHPLIIEAVELQVINIHEKAVCRISQNLPSAFQPFKLSPNDMHSRTFDLDNQKLSLDDRLTTYFDLQLLLTWRRDIPSSLSTTTILPAPELAILFGEPRVLASAEACKGQAHFIDLNYTIENPSMHLLSFNVSMDASEDFAFSGPKATAVQLIPISKHTVRYRLLPLVKGKWISPQVKIVDVHWNKMLKPVATGEMKSDKRGILLWVDAED